MRRSGIWGQDNSERRSSTANNREHGWRNASRLGTETIKTICRQKFDALNDNLKSMKKDLCAMMNRVADAEQRISKLEDFKTEQAKTVHDPRPDYPMGFMGTGPGSHVYLGPNQTWWSSQHHLWRKPAGTPSWLTGPYLCTFPFMTGGGGGGGIQCSKYSWNVCFSSTPFYY